MSDLVTLTIDGVEVKVPKGTLVVDAAKRIQNDIPVFCYHPKLEPVGMCRMCLVEIGLPVRDRSSGEVLKNEDGSVQLSFRGLQTACTVQVSEGMGVRTASKNVTAARESMIEFLLTSHPLDCPICDKGGECPLQNLTMAYGRGTSRMIFSDKLKMDKHVPLGDLIFLDRERCIQCARCIRFQEEVVDDPVIRFHSRGRELEIVTFSNPGFDSHWSGNTTDICPVGALTTADFRFGARPWELTPVASICPHCPVGCNTTLSTRREAKSGGRHVIKRIMPRQNEAVNEIWICDKGRFVHHFAEDPDRLKVPLVRKQGELVESSWDEALGLVAEQLRRHNVGVNGGEASSVAGLCGDRLSNEDYFLFQKLFRQGLKSNNIDLANRTMEGGEIVAQVGIASGSDLKELASGDVIMVVASDLHQEAPVWWTRVKQAAERGAKLVVLNARPTRLDKCASHVLHYPPGQGPSMLRQLVSLVQVDTESVDDQQIVAVAKAVADANNLVAFYGAEGLTPGETAIVARLLGNLLQLKTALGEGGEEGSAHAGRRNSGLVPVWPSGNTQGAWDMGIHPALSPGYGSPATVGMDAAAVYEGLSGGDVKALYVMGADPVGDGLMPDRGQLEFLVVQELFMTETAAQADVVLPAQSWAEREGTFTSGERRVQRYYPAIPPVGNCRPDWQILAQAGERFGLGKPAVSASLAFREIAQTVPQYREMDYRLLAHTEPQWPDVGGDDLYYGGNAYENRSGLGQQWSALAEKAQVGRFETGEVGGQELNGLALIGVAALYSPGTLIGKSALLDARVSKPTVTLHTTDASPLGVLDGDEVVLRSSGWSRKVEAHVTEDTVAGLALLRGASCPPGTSIAQLLRVEETEKELA